MSKSNSSIDLSVYALIFAIGGLGVAFLVYQDQQQQNAPVVQGDPPPESKPAPASEAWADRRPRPPVQARDDDADPVGFAVEPPDIIRLGWGWSQSRAEAIPTVCVVFDAQPRDAAQDSTISISEVRDTYAMSKAMKVSASVSVKTAVASGSGSASFAKNSSVSSTSVNYLVSAEVMNAAMIAAPKDEPTSRRRAAVRLTDDAAALARRNIEAFQDICGEGYVSSVKSGARAYMLATTKTSSREDRETVRASAKGSGWGVKVSAAAAGSSATSSSRFERTLTFYQQGGAAGDGVMTTADIELYGRTEEGPVTFPSSDLPSNAAEGIARIKKLAESAAAAGKIFEAHITPYQVLENFPRNADILAEEVEQDEIAAAWGAYTTLYADLKQVLEDPGDFAVPIRTCTDGSCTVTFTAVEGSETAIAMIEGLQDMVLISQDMIEDAAAQCLIDEEHCTFDEASVRSPYAVRASMPILIPVKDVTGDTTNAANSNATANPPPGLADLKAPDHLALHLREPSQGRCIFGARTPGCISNTEMRGWAARTGLLTQVVDDPEAVKAEVLACGVPSDAVITGEANNAGAPTIWYPLGISWGADGALDCGSFKPADDGEEEDNASTDPAPTGQEG